jgi:hypothetical protein
MSEKVESGECDQLSREEEGEVAAAAFDRVEQNEAIERDEEAAAAAAAAAASRGGGHRRFPSKWRPNSVGAELVASAVHKVEAGLAEMRSRMKLVEDGMRSVAADGDRIHEKVEGLEESVSALENHAFSVARGHVRMEVELEDVEGRLESVEAEVKASSRKVRRNHTISGGASTYRVSFLEEEEEDDDEKNDSDRGLKEVNVGDKLFPLPEQQEVKCILQGSHRAQSLGNLALKDDEKKVEYSSLQQRIGSSFSFETATTAAASSSCSSSSSVAAAAAPPEDDGGCQSSWRRKRTRRKQLSEGAGEEEEKEQTKEEEEESEAAVVVGGENRHFLLQIPGIMRSKSFNESGSKEKRPSTEGKQPPSPAEGNSPAQQELKSDFKRPPRSPFSSMKGKYNASTSYTEAAVASGGGRDLPLRSKSMKETAASAATSARVKRHNRMSWNADLFERNNNLLSASLRAAGNGSSENNSLSSHAGSLTSLLSTDLPGDLRGPFQQQWRRQIDCDVTFRDLLQRQPDLAKFGYLDLKKTTGFAAYLSYKNYYCALSRDSVFYVFPAKSGSSGDRDLKAKQVWDLAGGGDFEVRRISWDGKELKDPEKKTRYFQLVQRAAAQSASSPPQQHISLTLPIMSAPSPPPHASTATSSAVRQFQAATKEDAWAWFENLKKAVEIVYPPDVIPCPHSHPVTPLDMCDGRGDYFGVNHLLLSPGSQVEEEEEEDEENGQEEFINGDGDEFRYQLYDLIQVILEIRKEIPQMYCSFI